MQGRHGFPCSGFHRSHVCALHNAAFPWNDPTLSLSPQPHSQQTHLTLCTHKRSAYPPCFLLLILEWNILGLGSDTEVLVQHKNDGFCNKMCPGSGYVCFSKCKIEFQHPGCCCEGSVRGPEYVMMCLRTVIFTPDDQEGGCLLVVRGHDSQAKKLLLRARRQECDSQGGPLVLSGRSEGQYVALAARAETGPCTRRAVGQGVGWLCPVHTDLKTRTSPSLLIKLWEAHSLPPSP
jgi:hypothetical protein